MKSKLSKMLMMVISMVLLIGLNVSTASAAEISRVYGNDRFDTSAAISSANWSSSDNVVLSTGEGNDTFADALAGTILADTLNAPMLLTNKSALPQVISNEITRLAPKNVYILGGTGVVSQDVEDQLKSQGYNVVRLCGLTRYDTAVKIAEQVEKSIQVQKVYLTTGYKFQYALASASYVGKEKAVTLFTDGDTLNPATKDMIEQLKANGVTVTILGGDQIVSPKVESELTAMGVSFTRIDGNTPQEFNSNVLSTLGQDISGIAVANDSIFADSLSGSVVAAKNNLAITLVGNSFDYNIDKSKVNKVMIFGGTGAVPASVETTLKGLYGDAVVTPTPVPPTPVVTPVPTNTTDSYPVTLKETDPLTVDSTFKTQLDDPINGVGISVNTVADAEKVSHLWIGNVSDLQGIQYFKNIKTLTLVNCDIKDLAFLSRFTNLEQLEITGSNSLQSLNGVESLTSLTYIGIINCPKFTDISAVSNLKNLDSLIFATDGSGNPIDLNYVKGLTKMTTFSTNGTIVKNESTLGNLTNLSTLTLNNSDLKDASFVSNLHNLVELSMTGNPHLAIIGDLKGAVNLKYFSYESAIFKDLSIIKDNVNLVHVGLTPEIYNDNPEVVQTLISRGVEIVGQ